MIVRAQAHPAKRPAFGDFKAARGACGAQDATGAWSGAFARGTANRGDELDDQEAGGKTVPQLMTVGDQNPQMFACAGGRSNDRAVRTTLLFEVKPPTRSPLAGGGTRLIQDLLSETTALRPPTATPSPAYQGGPQLLPRRRSPIALGTPSPRAVQCAMTQNGDDVATRELHMLTVANGHLLHSVASNFSTATTGAESASSASTRSRSGKMSPRLSVSTSARSCPRRSRGLSPDRGQCLLRRPGKRRQVSPLSHGALLERLLATRRRHPRHQRHAERHQLPRSTSPPVCVPSSVSRRSRNSSM